MRLSNNDFMRIKSLLDMLYACILGGNLGAIRGNLQYIRPFC